MKISLFFKTIFVWTILLLFLLYTLFPMVWLAVSSLKTNMELLGEPFKLPSTLQFGNYLNALTIAHLDVLFLNSIVISVSATVLNVLVASMASYVLSRYRFAFSKGLFTLFVAGIMVPINSLMVPYFLLIRKVGLYDTKLGLIVTYAAIFLPLSIFIIKAFMDSVPREIEEAAVIDGSGFFRTFFHVILPLSRSGLVTAATFQILSCWNEFLYAMLLTSSEKSRTLQLGIRFFSSQFVTDYTSMFAAIVISIIPSILIYVVLQNQIISGFTQGAVKG